MAIQKILFASLLICSLIQSSHGAEKERLFSELEKGSLEVTTKPSREGAGVVLDAGIDKISITWKLSSTGSKKEAEFKTIKVKLCYAPPSQVDRPWRKTHDELFKDKTCPHKIVARPYDKTTQSIDWILERDIPTGTYFVRAYAVDEHDHEVAFGQSTNEAKTTSLFSVQAISGRHKSLDIASVCFSVFSVLALLVFFVNEKRKAKIEQSK
ncbi:PREDICTED: high-affinity nitrate transporter 3.1 [Camelina sativa]|uniref:High-affinity nitrate transporter n=2 Tax=Camelina sativa TaxID=90675 RepID=A0ABM0UIN7_CAMSA|nr:PREDICTED: high-affinity nitrate transporter 3.1 [Camelina sativa]XP_010482331.1 PREDICTED: high-affinity nitrate transporter 3.1 [Camelina sativa]